jgi:hypothetical protein
VGAEGGSRLKAYRRSAAVTYAVSQEKSSSPEWRRAARDVRSRPHSGSRLVPALAGLAPERGDVFGCVDLAYVPVLMLGLGLGLGLEPSRVHGRPAEDAAAAAVWRYRERAASGSVAVAKC